MRRVQRAFLKLILTAVTFLAVSATQAADSPAVLDQPLSHVDARHLLLRTGIGVAPGELISFVGMTRADAIDKIIAGIVKQPTVAMPSWTQEPLPHYFANTDFNDEQRQRFRRERDAEFSQLRQWWVLNMLQTESPQTERLVLFWHDIFATNYNDLDRQSLAMARQNQTLREHAFGSWSTLLKAMIKDPALLRYLNADSNKKSAPNENLGRELMELFSLGEGNYDETTVKEAARALTGRTVSQSSNLAFLVQSWHQDQRQKTLFGERGNFDGDDLVDLIIKQPASASFLAKRFWNAFISDGPVDKAWLKSASAQFAESGHDIAFLYRHTLSSSSFWDEQHRGAIIKSPIDIVTGLARTLEFPKQQWRNFANWHASLGLDLFAPRNVSGWKEGAAFVTPGKLLSRFATVDAMTRSVAGSTEGDSNMMSKDSMMAPATTMMNQAATESGLLVRMAAEDYQGPVRFQVALRKAETTLWESEEQDFSGGHDTELFGRLETIDSAAWQLKHFAVTDEYLSEADSVIVRYTNDHAGPDGDRNLYIDGVQIEDHWLSASYGSQTSACVPGNSANAGNLYCSGELSIKLPVTPSQISEELPKYRAGGAHVLWAKKNNRWNKVSATFALTDVSTPAGYFHTIHFNVEAVQGQPMELRVDTFDCWPDCFANWPECAWQDKFFKATLTLNFPLIAKPETAKTARDDWCHYDDLPAFEQSLVSAIWHTVPFLIDTMGDTRRGKRRFTEPLKAFKQRLANSEVSIADSVYAKSSAININAAFASVEKPREPLPEPELIIQNVDSLEQALAGAQLSLDQLLLPGFNDPGINAMATDVTIPFSERLSRLLDTSAFQLR